MRSSRSPSRSRRLARALGLVAFALGACSVARAQAAAPAAGSASATLERFHAGLLDVMKRAKTLGYAGRHEVLAPLVRDTYDLPFMARTAAGKHWRALDETQQAKLVDAFTRMTIANYAGRFTGWEGDRFELRGEEPAGQETTLVRTALVGGDGKTTQLDYRLRHADGGGWRIIDVFLNGTVSELALRRSEYGAVIERDGFDALIASLDRKIAGLEKGESEK